jgi:metal-responsive CopG/Arc/MetJ family transcriptional regulator
MRKPSNKAAPKRPARERLRVISVGLKPSLIERVDVLAAREQRSRSQMIGMVLENFLAFDAQRKRA